MAVGLPSLLSWPMREMAWKSWGENWALLWQYRAGPCHLAMLGAAAHAARGLSLLSLLPTLHHA